VALFKRTKSLVGLDIGSSAVKAVELKAVGTAFKVVAVGSEPVPPDRIVDGAIIDGGVVSEAIKRVFESNGIRTKDVVASLSGNGVIVKKVTLPLMSEAELGESIYWEAEQYIPIDIQDVNLDYQMLKAGGGGEKDDPPELPALASLDEALPLPLGASFDPGVGARVPESDLRVVQGLENLLNAIMRSQAGTEGPDRR
jgi:type IV pilus assembly protein PilM